MVYVHKVFVHVGLLTIKILSMWIYLHIYVSLFEHDSNVDFL